MRAKKLRNGKSQSRFVDWIVFYAVSAIYQPYNGGFEIKIQKLNILKEANIIFQNLEHEKCGI